MAKFCPIWSHYESVNLQDSLRFGWFESQPEPTVEGLEWKSVKEAREVFGAEGFDDYLKQELTCSLAESANINDLWRDFKQGA